MGAATATVAVRALPAPAGARLVECRELLGRKFTGFRNLNSKCCTFTRTMDKTYSSGKKLLQQFN